MPTEPQPVSGKRDLVYVRYINHRGETACRLVRPIRLWFGSTAWHPEPQWLMECFDVQKGETRDFAMSNVLTWVPFSIDQT